jgi:hypothetical protein
MRCRSLFSAVLFWVVSGLASLGQTSLQGSWQGQFACGSTGFAFTLTVRGVDQNRFTGRVTVRPDGRRGAAEFEAAGSVDPASGRFELRPTQVLARFPGFQPAPYRGTIDPGGRAARAEAVYPGCQEFALVRDGASGDTAQQGPTFPARPAPRAEGSPRSDNSAPRPARTYGRMGPGISNEQAAQAPTPADAPELRPVIGDWTKPQSQGAEAPASPPAGVRCRGR